MNGYFCDIFGNKKIKHSWPGGGFRWPGGLPGCTIIEETLTYVN